jgi:hypothetical protein
MLLLTLSGREVFEAINVQTSIIHTHAEILICGLVSFLHNCGEVEREREEQLLLLCHKGELKDEAEKRVFTFISRPTRRS